MRKDEIRSVIKNLCFKYEEIERYHPRFVDSIIERALTEYYNLIFLRNPKELERYTKQFGYTSAIGVSYEASTGLYYSNYPTMTDGTNVTTVPIPDKASGVRRISTMIQGGASFYPLDAREMDLIMSGSYTNTLTARIGYCPRRTRVDYYNLTAAVILGGVRMDLLIPFSKYEETDTVLVPELMSDEGMGFTDRIMAILKEVKPVELFENKQFEETKE